MASFTSRSQLSWLWRLNLLRRGPQVEFFQSPTLYAPAGAVTKDTDGSASGDSTASAEGDSVYAPVQIPTAHLLAEQAPRRTQRLTVPEDVTQRPLPIAIINTRDAAGSATGDATADGSLDAFGDFAGSATGDATASAAGTSTYDYPQFQTGHLLESQGFRQRQRIIVELQRPLPIAIIGNRDTDGTATGDATASGSLDAFGDFAGSASGDATASGEGASTYDYPQFRTDHLLDKQGARPKQKSILEISVPTPIAANVTATTRDGDGTASGDSTASGALDALADFAGTASGDSTASAEAADNLFDAITRLPVGIRPRGRTLDRGTQIEFQSPITLLTSTPAAGNVDGDGTATGDSTASGSLDAFADMAGTATGDSTCDGFIEDATPVVVTPPVVETGGTGVSVFPGAWTKRTKKPKKKRVDELEEMIAELRSRIVEVPEAADDGIYERALRVGQALASNPADASLTEINNAIAQLQAALAEIDDEEAILLLAA